MGKVKFLHCADIHMDAPFTSLGWGAGKAAARRQDIRDTFSRVVNIARDQEVDMLLISGDLYEHNYIRKSTLNFINSLFCSIPHIMIFIVPGNHDPLVEGSYYNTYKWSDNVHIFNGESTPKLLKELGVCVYGVAFNDFLQSESLVKGLKCVDSEYINILLVHGTVDMDVGSELYNPMKSSELKSLGVDYVALGHFHNRLDNIGGAGIIYNPGSPEALGFDETGLHGVNIGTIEKENGVLKDRNIIFFPTGKRFYRNIDVNVDGCESDIHIVTAIDNAILDERACDTLYSITIKGYRDKEFKPDTARISLLFQDKVFFLKIKDETTPDYDFESLKNEAGLKGLFVRKIFSLIENTKDHQRKELLMRSLYYGLEALENGEVEVVDGKYAD